MADTVARAFAFKVPGSAQKARLLADLVRGTRALQAITMLNVMPQTAARIVSKVIRSAVANAEHNMRLNGADLLVKTIMIDEGPSRRGRRYGARGRMKPIKHRSSHITVELAEAER